MPCFLVEIPVPHSDAVVAARAMRTVGAAQSRLAARGIVVRPLLSGRTTDGWLLCVMLAASADAVRTLVALALLPAGRVCEIVRVEP